MLKRNMESEDRTCIVMKEYTEQDEDEATLEPPDSKKLEYEKQYDYQKNFNIIPRPRASQLPPSLTHQQQHARVEVCLTQADVNGNTGVTKTQVVPPTVIITGVTEDETEDHLHDPNELKPYTFSEMCLVWTVENPKMLCLLIIVVSFSFTFLLTILQYFT